MDRYFYRIINLTLGLLLAVILMGCSYKEKSNLAVVPVDKNPTKPIEDNILSLTKYEGTKYRDYQNINEVKIPVLMFHSIKSNGKNDLIMSPVEFEKDMKWLKDNKYTTLSMEKLYLILTTGKNVPERPIVLTFDDGYEDNYTNAFPVLKKYNFKATVFLITNYIGQNGFLKTDEIKEMYANNIDFQSHTANHQELNILSYPNQLSELKKSKEVIESLIHNNTNVLCYPVGKYNETTKKAAKDTGYKMCFTTKYGFSTSSDGFYTLTRVRMFPGMNLESIKRTMPSFSMQHDS